MCKIYYIFYVCSVSKHSWSMFIALRPMVSCCAWTFKSSAFILCLRFWEPLLQTCLAGLGVRVFKIVFITNNLLAEIF